MSALGCVRKEGRTCIAHSFPNRGGEENMAFIFGATPFAERFFSMWFWTRSCRSAFFMEATKGGLIVDWLGGWEDNI